MAKIITLSPTTINQIAAGEVVERPASVVKEVVENAIDAGATLITVAIEGGGIDLIRITDNGFGIDKADIRGAFLRHATSKIREIEDLNSVFSLGFRGEALASIASVAKVELLTKVKADTTGTRYVIEGGIEASLQDVGCPDGTTLIIRDLFFNTPVRKKFLKASQTEGAYVLELLMKLAMGHPEIGFKCIQNGKVKLHTPGTNKLEDVIYEVYGKGMLTGMLSLDYEQDGIRLTGLIGKPELARSNRNFENYYLNGRYIKSKTIMEAVETAYAPVLLLHRFPVFVMHIQMASDQVDVNVHPTKMDVRFSDDAKMREVLLRAIDCCLKAQELIPQVTFVKETYEKRPPIPKSTSLPEPFEIKRINETPVLEGLEELDLVEELNQLDKKVVDVPEIHEQITIDLPFVTQSARKDHKIVGQLFDTYWIVAFLDKYYIIDQHAAHERVLYERLIKAYEAHQVPSQGLLSPVVIPVSQSEMLLYTEHESLFAQLGFDLAIFGEDALMMRGVPFIFNKAIEAETFLQVLDTLDLGQKQKPVETLLQDLAGMACKMAVKAHDRLSQVECHQLIDDLLSLDNPFNCPHGRPTIIAMTRYELEKKFKRIV